MSDIEEKKPGLKDIIKDSKSKKMLIFVGVVIFGALAYVFMGGGSSDPETNSRLLSAPDGNRGVESTDNISPAYEDALRQADSQRLNEARERGESAMPSLITGSSDQRPPVITIEEEEEVVEENSRPVLPDAVNVEAIRLPTRSPPPSVPNIAPQPGPIQQTPPEPQPQNQGATQQQATVPQPLYDRDAYGRMMSQMERLMDDNRRQYTTASTEYFYSASDAQGGENSGQGAAGDQTLTMRGNGETGLITDASANDAHLENLLPLPGEILYAEMVSRATSDAPGPVLARVLEGPFAGSTVLGQFSVAQEALVIQFNSMTIRRTRDGEEINQNIPINAVAVDVEHIGTAMATDVDRHLFERIAIGFATSFIRGIGEAIGNSGSTTIDRSDGSSVTQNESLNTREQVYIGAGQAAGDVGDILNEYYGNRPTTITVDSGTTMGLLFLN